ncbi:DUF742 domain-containing protein [Prauserella halophila]|uniref:DUF742 domain-containing protein n=1 Tax=Prauserella halophila TaxID=185641 RepID=A0ABP4GT55_9PSEU|nr:DUF742 domain-containing protein [Prauserella halophila]MCP2235624.1 Protein of unknown function (DUF742) [Prauserella halophila]
MDSGHSRGDRRPDRAPDPGPADEQDGRADEAWRPIRPSKRVDRESDWLYQSDEEPDDPADFSVSEYRERLMGGPGSELYGSHEVPPRSGRPEREDPDFSSGYHVPYAENSPRGSNEGARDVDRYDDEFGRDGYDTGEFRTGGFGTGRFPPVDDGFRPSPVPRQSSGDTFGPQRIDLGGSGPVPEETPSESSGLVRPYFRTKGRTRPSQDLAVETLISTSERGRRLDGVRVPEHKHICGLCLDTRSVAEVAALLKMPLGVVRVLVGDVAGLGLVLVHSPNTNTMVGDRPSIEFMERVLSGLRRI